MTSGMPEKTGSLLGGLHNDRYWDKSQLPDGGRVCHNEYAFKKSP